MNFRFDFRSLHFHIGLSRSVQVQGVNSKLPDGRHILMWDFDNVEEDNVIKALLQVQRRYKLPTIYLINTGLPLHYHAYSFVARSFADVIRILYSTEGIDKVYFKIGIVREFFTLRYSPKRGREFKLVLRMPSKYGADVDPYQIANFTQYWTKRV